MHQRDAAARLLAVVMVVGLGMGNHAQLVRAQIGDRPSQQRFAPRPGTAVPAGVEVLRVLGQVYLVAGTGGNVVVQTGPQGVFVVDTGTAARAGDLLAAIRTISDGTIYYIVNTTADTDHFGGNPVLAKAGWSPIVPLPDLAGDGAPAAAPDPSTVLAMVLAHEGLLHRISAPTGETALAPFAFWPTSTFFTAKKTLSFNHEGIELRHQPAAHTDGDLTVFFRKSDVIAAGDLIDADGYPRFEAARGGSLAGLLAGLNDVIDISIAEFNQQGGTRIVPGHGRIMNETDVADYRDMATIIRDRVQRAVDEGLTLEQVQALRPTLDYDGLYARPAWTGQMFVEGIYQELTRAAAGARRP